jgi:hypothetical protein
MVTHAEPETGCHWQAKTDVAGAQCTQHIEFLLGGGVVGGEGGGPGEGWGISEIISNSII